MGKKALFTLFGAMLIFISMAVAYLSSLDIKKSRFSDLPPQVNRIIADWASCRGTYIGQKLNDQQSPGQLVEAALNSCVPYERELELELSKLGPTWKGKSAEFRVRAKEHMINEVKQLRLGATAKDPTSAWSQCVGSNLHDVSDEAFERDFDGAIATCAHLEPAVLRQFATTYGHQVAQENLNYVKQIIKDQARIANQKIR